jgi:uncharacterized protein
MQGVQVSFFTQQDRVHAGKPVAQWLLSVAEQLGIRGATVFAASEGVGHDGKLHSARFFELADQPQEVQMVLSHEQCERIFDRITQENLRVFYVKTPAEFGTTGEP